MIGIGRGTDPKAMNETTIAFDKLVLEGLDRNRPAHGYPPAQEEAILEMRTRILTYEKQNGAVDPKEVSDRQDAQRASMFSFVEAMTKQLRPDG